ncbi:hypothetical protein [Kitasatospora sp. NPDC085464]|uniref:hypothetical protein n=1 Tax=Kitasatospora sp. NPDC085464 TaxID=3364063 RepID=UPI0037C69143
MTRLWILPALIVLSGTVVAARPAAEGDTGTAAALLLVFLLLAAVNTPLVFPRSVSAAEAQRRSAADGRPVVFWRPGSLTALE